MKLSLKWLNEFVNIEDLSVDEICQKAVKAGFEVEEIKYLASATNLVVGKIIECKKHPDSDHLHITKVDIGDEILDIVCGAPNCRKDLKVIVAKVGAKLPEIEIKSSVIRGIKSNGMICSLLELGVDKDLLDDNSTSLNGIEELSDDFNVGDADIIEKLGYDDVILDLSIYANRPDCLSMFAMAKEMAAILDRDCILPNYKDKANIGEDVNFNLKSETENCPHFLIKVVNEVKIKESPKWIKDYLRANGIKAINNLVDISNIVMLETGQPLHFYDLRTNPKHEIIVKDNYEGEFIALDGINYKIEKDDLMIFSNNNPIGIAGIMGGDDTKILDDTTSLIIEAALFNAAQVRRTANRLGLMTEAAMRFSKGLEPLAQIKAIDRATDLLIKYADAKKFEKTIEYGNDNYQEITVIEDINHLNKLLGKEYTINEVEDVLRRLDFNPVVNDNIITSHIPSYRTDIRIKEDIDEEVARLTDFDDLKSTLPYMPQTIGYLNNSQSIKRNIKNILLNNGLQEVITYSLISNKQTSHNLLPFGKQLEVKSPLSEDHRYIRMSLLSSLIEIFKYNIDHYNENINIFEFSKVYAKDMEQERLGILLNGNLIASPLKKININVDFYIIKSLVLDILNKLGFEKGRITIKNNEKEVNIFHPYQSCLITMEGETIAILGKLHPSFINENKLSDIYYAEIILNKLTTSNPSKIKAPIISKYPCVNRDLSLIVKDNILAADIIKMIKKTGGQLVKNVEAFDIYQGDNIEKGYKSISFNIIFESFDQTLKNDDIAPIIDKIINVLEKEYDANLRS